MESVVLSKRISRRKSNLIAKMEMDKKRDTVESDEAKNG